MMERSTLPKPPEPPRPTRVLFFARVDRPAERAAIQNPHAPGADGEWDVPQEAA